jgi:Skp family chaperone for outer membrane proteins
MRKYLPLSIFAILALAGAVFTAVRPMSAEETSPAEPVAVVNLDGVLVKYEKYNIRKAKVDERQQELADEISGEEKALGDLIRKRDACASDSEEWWDFDRKYRAAAAELDSRAGQAQTEIDRLDNELFMEIFNDIEAAIGEYAEMRGIKIVLWKKSVVLSQATAAQRAAALNPVSVLYAVENVDITDAVSESLNKSFAGDEN